MSKQTRTKSSTSAAAKTTLAKPKMPAKPATKSPTKAAAPAKPRAKAASPSAGKRGKAVIESSRLAPGKTVKPSRAKSAATKAPAKPTAKPTAKAVAKPIAKRVAKPTAAKSVTTEPTVASKPVAVKPAVVKPVAVKPVAAEPAVVATPVVVKPVAVKPVVVKPVAKPTTIVPAAVEPPPRKGVLAEGDKAPSFELPRDGGGTVSLQSFAGRKLVIFFYPRASTPGCTKEAIDFTRLADDFAAAGVGVLGISADSQKAQDAFRDKYQLTTPLLSDETHRVLEAYGVWGEKSMYGKVFQGILRTTVLIGADGRVVKIWRNVKVDGHADAVLETARELE